MRDVKCVKKIIIITLFNLSLVSFSQEKSSLKIESINNGTGIYTLEKNDDRSGVSGVIQANFKLDNHLLSSSISLGLGVLNEDEILKNTVHTFITFDLLYGRRILFNENLYLNLFSGIGILEQTKLKNKENGTSLNIPIQLQLYFSVSSKLDLGIMPRLNLNNKNTISMYLFSINLKL
ncbi:hypothetical protein [Lacinutrix sp.]|uniref:hypothetical protein n=1 Tax=Lacinutrix sp. TaxID=1937692 RepID=UPI002628258A|nr:hypothetical protein [Lacinutrix sp.]MDG1714667.1 hypothetical protein [Lacinutrix sp.]